MKKLAKIILAGMIGGLTLTNALADDAYIRVVAPNQYVANFFNQHIGYYVQKNRNGSYMVNCKAVARISLDQLVSLSGGYQVDVKKMRTELDQAKNECGMS